jgi:hypothetical protein
MYEAYVGWRSSVCASCGASATPSLASACSYVMAGDGRASGKPQQQPPPARRTIRASRRLRRMRTGSPINFGTTGTVGKYCRMCFVEHTKYCARMNASSTTSLDFLQENAPSTILLLTNYEATGTGTGPRQQGIDIRIYPTEI